MKLRWFQRTAILPVVSNPDPQAQRIAELEKELAELKELCARQKSRILEAEVDMLVSLAIDEGKMLPDLRQWAVVLGRTNYDQLQAFVAEAPFLPGRGQS
jgi:hypothetical protein